MSDWKVKADDALQAEDAERMRKLVEQMPERMRRVITLRKLYGHSQQQIASELGMTMQEVEDEIVAAVKFCADPGETGEDVQ